MMDHRECNNMVFIVFHVLCIILTVLMVTYNVILYSADEDLSEVSYKMYNEDEESAFPGITICIASPFESKKLEAYGMGIDKSTYQKFLRGQLWEEQMLKINFQNVTLNINDYLIEACIKQTFNGHCLNFDPYIDTFFEPSRYQCFSFQNPSETNILYVETKINASLFPNKIRPEKWEFVVRFPFPTQIFRSATISFGEWQNRQNLPNGFTMNFYVRNVQVIKRRNRASRPCFTWKNYDHLMMKAITDNLECRPVYWGIHTNTPICNSKEKMAAFERYFFNHYFGSNESVSDIPPCIEIESMNIEYSDIEAEDQNKIEENNAERYHSQEPLDWFKVRLWFRSNQFMEIKQVRGLQFPRSCRQRRRIHRAVSWI